jgi:hypothetical protein
MKTVATAFGPILQNLLRLRTRLGAEFLLLLVDLFLKKLVCSNNKRDKCCNFWLRIWFLPTLKNWIFVRVWKFIRDKILFTYCPPIWRYGNFKFWGKSFFLVSHCSWDWDPKWWNCLLWNIIKYLQKLNEAKEIDVWTTGYWDTQNHKFGKFIKMGNW